MATLAFERGADSGQAGGLTMIPLKVDELVEMARVFTRDGRPAIDDPLVRDQLVRFAIEERAIRLNLARLRVPALHGDHPLGIMLMTKLVVTEFRRRLSRFAVSLQGEDGKLFAGDPDAFHDGDWQRHYMNAYSSTIGGGTSQVQLNILGERVLGLAKG
jgi:alkylation response protein AidB-like acyl-CoA dehydrogenase